MNKLFCTFTLEDNLEETLHNINNKYSILYNKIFVLKSPQSEELVCTYNIDMGNLSGNVIENTILVHRKKETNTLYSINALNTLVKKLNNGLANRNYPINWKDYSNCILLATHNSDLRRLDTTIHSVVNTNINS